MRPTIIILIAVFTILSIIISLGFLTSQEYIDVSEITSQHDQLEFTKNELEKINQQNLKILSDLEEQIQNSNDAHIEQINGEIEIIKRVLEENTAELEKVITKLSQMESNP